MARSPFSKFKLMLLEYGLEKFGLYYGWYKAKVLVNDDPEKRGRVQVKCVAIYGDDEPPFWAKACGMYSGKETGDYAIPQVGDAIWLTFERGSAQFPIWHYGWYAENFAPDTASHEVFVRQYPDGSKLEVNTATNKILLWRKAGRAIEITDAHISLGTEGGSAEPAVLGDQNASTLESMLDHDSSQQDDIIAFCSTQIAAAGTVPLLAPLVPGYTTLSTQAIARKTAIIATKTTEVPLTKSNIVNLD